MTRILAIALALVAFASAGSAVTLTVQPDKLTYNVGETVFLTVTGDPQSGKDSEIYGRLEYSAALTTTLTSSQTQHHRACCGFVLTGSLERGDGFADVFNQIIDGGGQGYTVDNVQIATATLIADAAGVVDVFWSDDPGHELDFFGLTNASLGSPPNPVATFCIGPLVGCPVPEPTTGAMLGLGVLALAAGHRLVSPDTQKRPPTH